MSDPALPSLMVTWSLWWSARCAWSSPGTCPSPAAPQVSVSGHQSHPMTVSCRSHHLQVLQEPGAALPNLQTSARRQHEQSGRGPHRESQTQVNSSCCEEAGSLFPRPGVSFLSSDASFGTIWLAWCVMRRSALSAPSSARPLMAAWSECS